MTPKHISSQDYLPLPKDRNYATVRKGRTQVIKYQTIGNAKLALNVAAHDSNYHGKNLLDHIEIYKLHGPSYIKIFDSDSELANLYRCGALTYQQMVARIFE